MLCTERAQLQRQRFRLVARMLRAVLSSCRRSSEVSMLSGSPGSAEAAAARPKSGSLIHVVRMLTAESRNRKCRGGPHVLPLGSRANIETLPIGGGEHNHDPTTTAQLRPDDDDDRNAAASTTTATRQVGDAGRWLSTTKGEDRGEDQR